MSTSKQNSANRQKSETANKPRAGDAGSGLHSSESREDGEKRKAGTGKNQEARPVEETLDRLSVDPEYGLDREEAKKRLQDHGPNAIEEEKQHAFLKFLSYFWGPIPWLLEAAIILAGIAERWEDFGVILAMLAINGGVGFWHENKAQNAIEALKKQLAPQARVIREGKRKTIESREVVPGDIVLLRIGNIVPADAQLLQKQKIEVDESALTGESLPVDKTEGETCYSGTTVKRGEALAVVTGTGADTEFAHTVALVESAKSTSHFQRAVLRIGYFLIASTVFLTGAIVVVGWWRGDPWLNLLLFAMVLVIAGIPAALPAVMTVTMTVGANRLAKMRAIVSRLASMEEMAGLKILCADKTGTLTRNELELQDPVILAAEDKHDLVVAAALTAERDEPDPIDSAILAALEDEGELEAFDITDFTPFDPTSKRAEAEVNHEGKAFRVAKGAPQVILDLCGAQDGAQEDVSARVDDLANDGFRALGVARKENGDWIYLGILPFLDPPRDDTAEVIQSAHDHGIDVRMVTGDHVAIAKQVAGQVGLGQNIRGATNLFGEHGASGDEDRIGDVLEADGFAQVAPEDKFEIVKHFQAGDKIIGMTGDGVNDAPALKQADVGIAVSGATEAARAASDLVLTEKGLGVIIRAVEEARRIFERMVSYATYRITETVRVLIFISASILAFNFYPVTPIMIVLLALLNDIPIMTIATDNVATAVRPVRWDMRRVLTTSALLGFSGVVSTFLFFWYVQTIMQLPANEVQTLIFLKLLVAGHMTIFVTRNTGWFLQRPWPSLSLFLTLEATQLTGTVVAIFGVLVHPIPWQYALAVWGYALFEMLLMNAVKVLMYYFAGSAWSRS